VCVCVREGEVFISVMFCAGVEILRLDHYYLKKLKGNSVGN